MEALMCHMESLGVKWRTVLAPGLVYNVHHFSGVVFQVVANVQRKKKTVMDVLAAGGRYDHLVRTVVCFVGLETEWSVVHFVCHETDWSKSMSGPMVCFVYYET